MSAARLTIYDRETHLDVDGAPIVEVRLSS